ncbi:MAG: riboflavin synthase [Deltaproteobacteria bacterium]|nr:riboflavin synthase [Deltaproteobacteria bacterium]
MFTGIIEDIGTVTNVTPLSMAVELELKTTKIPLDEVKLGDSIAINGICLTVTSKKHDENKFSVQAVKETIDRTTLTMWKKGSLVNLERALSYAGRIDGHLVSGHVDDRGRITRINSSGAQTTFTVNYPPELKSFLSLKGSICVDGISLTVASLSSAAFDVAVIPFTKEHTILRYKRVGDLVNLEVDLIARHVYAMMNPRR